MSRKVMILGAGHEQVPILRTTLGTGAEIILISPPGNYPGFQYAHRYLSETKHKGSRKGAVLVFGKTKKECCDICDKVNTTLRIDVEAANGDISGIQW